MDKEILLQRALDDFVDKAILYRMKNISKNDFVNALNDLILLFTSMNREKEIKSFLVNSLGCGVIDKSILTDAHLFWLGKVKNCKDFSPDFTCNVLDMAIKVCLLSRSGYNMGYDNILKVIFREIFENDKLDIFDLCRIAKYLSYACFDTEFEVNFVNLIISYVYAYYKVKCESNELIDYWFGERRGIDDKIKDYLKFNISNIYCKINDIKCDDYIIHRVLIDGSKYVFFVIPRVIFVYKVYGGGSDKFVVYNIVNRKVVGGINKWSELIEYIREHIGVNVDIKPQDKVWMGISDFKSIIFR